MQKLKVVVLVAVVISLLMIFFGRVLLPWYLKNKLAVKIDKNQASSIGIIGGADGPTAVFITGKITSRPFMLIFKVISVLGMIFLFLTRS